MLGIRRTEAIHLTEAIALTGPGHTTEVMSAMPHIILLLLVLPPPTTYRTPSTTAAPSYNRSSDLEESANKKTTTITVLHKLKKPLKFGDRGDSVKVLQCLLNVHGYETDISGEYDTKTLSQVVSFQSKRHQEENGGQVGPKTWSALSLKKVDSDSLKVISGNSFSCNGIHYRIKGIGSPDASQNDFSNARDRLKALLESGKSKLQVVGADPDSHIVVEAFVVRENITESIANILEKDTRYVALAHGIVRDKKTGLEWKVGPDKGMDWENAKAWVHSLALDGGWRMPTIAELTTLYNKNAGNRNMTPVLKMSGRWVWSCENEDGSNAYCLNFDRGSRFLADISSSGNMRVFAVRSQK